MHKEKIKKYIELYLKNKAGFTLMDMLASLFIFALITGLFLANYHGARERNKLILAVQEAASNIRLAQSYSLGTKEYGAAVPVDGWGIHFDSNFPDNSNYIIFPDANDQGNYQYAGNNNFKVVNLPNDITINSIKVNGASASSVDIVFLPPDPKTYINNDNISTARITFKEGKTNTIRTVEVNFFGLIDVVD